MTDWQKLQADFPDEVIKTRPGRGGMTFRYVDARVVAARLDDVLTPEGWDFQWTLEPDGVVHGKLIIGTNIREDAGYPNSDDDEEPIKSAVSDALKRAAVLYGVGRHLYTDNKPGQPVRAAPQATARPAPTLVRPDDDLLEPDDDDLAALETTAPMRRPEPEVIRCPNHPSREPRQNSRGWYCSGKDPNGKNGFCEWTRAA